MVDAHTSIVLYGIHSSWVFRIVITGSSTSNVSVDTVIHEAFCLFGGGVTTFEDGGSGDGRDIQSIHSLRYSMENMKKLIYVDSFPVLEVNRH